MAKRVYKKGMTFFNLETKEKIIFGKWNSDGTAACISDNKLFLNIPREELDNKYGSYSEMERKARETRRGQAW
ncbi:hypothetical protein ACFLZV_02400 [Candidatus Margulisiibacteriota bacterium]